MKQLPVATRSDCTQVDVLETFELAYSAGGGFSAKIIDAEVEFNACEAEEDDNDLAAYWREINRGDAEESAKIDRYLVGEGERRRRRRRSRRGRRRLEEEEEEEENEEEEDGEE